MLITLRSHPFVCETLEDDNFARIVIYDLTLNNTAIINQGPFNSHRV